MSRLTRKIDNGNYRPNFSNFTYEEIKPNDIKKINQLIYNKLAEYENIGLTPQGIIELRDFELLLFSGKSTKEIYEILFGQN